MGDKTLGILFIFFGGVLLFLAGMLASIIAMGEADLFTWVLFILDIIIGVADLIAGSQHLMD